MSLRAKAGSALSKLLKGLLMLSYEEAPVLIRDNPLLTSTEGGLLRTNCGVYSGPRKVIAFSLFVEMTSVFIPSLISPIPIVFFLGIGSSDGIVVRLCSCF